MLPETEFERAVGAMSQIRAMREQHIERRKISAVTLRAPRLDGVPV